MYYIYIYIASVFKHIYTLDNSIFVGKQLLPSTATYLCTYGQGIVVNRATP